jgi:hypothetical protein
MEWKSLGNKRWKFSRRTPIYLKLLISNNLNLNHKVHLNQTIYSIYK